MATATILPASEYNKLLLDHDAISKAEVLYLKSCHTTKLIDIIKAHGLDDVLEVHVLHRHFALQTGEAMVHKEIRIKDNIEIVIDIAKAIKCPGDSGNHLIPVMWYLIEDGRMVQYEYAIRMGNDRQTSRVVDNVPTGKLETFAKEFSNYVWNNGLQDIVSLKDKSCVVGLEFVAYECRALFKVPASVVTLHEKSHLVETGWTLENGLTLMTDSHVTKARKTTGGTVADYHVTVTSEGINAFDPNEVSPMYTEKMWAAVENATFDNWCAMEA